MISTVTNLNFTNHSNNTIDNTVGDWSLVVGENNLYAINNTDNKKYKINLTELS